MALMPNGSPKQNANSSLNKKLHIILGLSYYLDELLARLWRKHVKNDSYRVAKKNEFKTSSMFLIEFTKSDRELI